jgi:hypothetical protein
VQIRPRVPGYFHLGHASPEGQGDACLEGTIEQDERHSSFFPKLWRFQDYSCLQGLEDLWSTTGGGSSCRSEVAFPGDMVLKRDVGKILRSANEDAVYDRDPLEDAMG